MNMPDRFRSVTSDFLLPLVGVWCVGFIGEDKLG